MKKFLNYFISLLIILVTIINVDNISNYLSNKISNNNKSNIVNLNKYAKDSKFLFLEKVYTNTPYSYQDLINLYYSIIDAGYQVYTFYCPKEYSNCIKDVSSISEDELILTHINNYVHPFNCFTSINTSITKTGEVTLDISYLYKKEDIDKIDIRVDELINQLIKDNMSTIDKVKTIHDYIINNTKYDVKRNLTGESEYSSYNAYGPLFEGFATCNGYTDLMAIFLNKLDIPNYKIATTPEEISYSATGHIWNALEVDGKWLHLDLTWDDPVSNDNKDYLFHTYFLKTTKEVKDADDGDTQIEEHNFNPLYYLEFN